MKEIALKITAEGGREELSVPLMREVPQKTRTSILIVIFLKKIKIINILKN